MWFTSDLRLSDHPALDAAARSGCAIIPCYIDDPELSGSRPGTAGRWWLKESLKQLGNALAERGGRLIVRSGDTRAELLALLEDTGAEKVFASRSYLPRLRALQHDLERDLAAIGVVLSLHSGALLHEPERIGTKDGKPFRVFTPFWKACLRESEPAMPLAPLGQIESRLRNIRSENLEDRATAEDEPEWAEEIAAAWRPGEVGAFGRLEEFLSGALQTYASDRDRPAKAGTSRLSPHLHFGEISPRQVWHAVTTEVVRRTGLATGAESFLRELGWREFSYHLLWHWPNFCERSFRSEFDEFPWRRDANHLAAWKRGRTGYPFVDAGMRELRTTGWMHNRVRMVTASFLVKDLLISWTSGAQWFEEALVDADLANNTASWQWVAGSGADAAPFFRIFNPTLQGKKFDPEGEYVRRWVPELRALPTRYVHDPASAPQSVLDDAGVTLGETYPRPLVDHAEAREAALSAFRDLRHRAARG